MQYAFLSKYRSCWLIWCPVGWLVGGCGARAVSCKTPIFFIIINVADIIVAGDLSPVRIIRWTSLQSQVTIIIMINITLTFLVIGTYPVNWRFETFPETFCECAINNSSSSGWRMCRNLRNNLRDSETIWEREKRKSPSNEWKVRGEDRQGRELFLRQAGEMVNRNQRRCWGWSTWRKVIKNVQTCQENLKHSKSFERGDGAGGEQEEGGGHQHQRTPSSLLSSTAFQIRWQSPSLLLIRVDLWSVLYNYMPAKLPSLLCVCYYPTGFWCAQSMDPICGCVTLFKARAPSDRKVRRQWQLLTVPKHSAQNLTPRIRLNISTSNFSPTL